MTTTTIEELIEKWTLSGKRPLPQRGTPNAAADETFKSLLQRLEFFEERFYSRFVPTLSPPHVPNFFERLLRWLTNEHLSDDDQRILFQVACRLAYFSFEDFLQLYRSAFTGPAARWIIDQLQLRIDNPNFQAILQEEQKRRTWYCPITDSMVISEFYHANHVTGIKQRPGFRALLEFGDPSRLRQYMTDNNLQRLVLLEDFVGTGAQSMSSVQWAVQNLQCPVLCQQHFQPDPG